MRFVDGEITIKLKSIKCVDVDRHPLMDFVLMHYYYSTLRFNVILSTTLQSWSDANLE
jgi:hypothetical protein